MKTSVLALKTPLIATVLALAAALSLPEPVLAKPGKKGGSSGHHAKSGKYKGGDYDHDYDYDHHHHGSAYYSYPHTSFSLTFGNGYAGQGYYYGPPGVPYYYSRPGVRYYRSWYLAPRTYWSGNYQAVSLGVQVQQALANRGYYGGPIDGLIGPQSRRAIANYQADQGLPPTGQITSSLLLSLGL